MVATCHSRYMQEVLTLLTCMISSHSGEVQQAGQAWAHGLGRGGLGVHLATVAVALDHFAGFTPPRQLYAGDVYRVWGGLPWDDGDFFTHGVLNML